MKFIWYIGVLAVLLSCSSNSDLPNENTLARYTLNETTETGAVIACAGSDMETNDVLVFYYPENGAIDVRLYETVDVEVDNSNFLNYTRIESEFIPFFNGTLGKFVRSLAVEKWIIVTYELNGEIKISNPIRTKQIEKPSVWNDEVTIDQDTSTMPIFNWINNAFGDNAIYFQIISDEENNLLSGTYTSENEFQYYNTSNVILNITPETPPNLTVGTSYNFTLMDVSVDNWVNLFILNKNFIAQ